MGFEAAGQGSYSYRYSQPIMGARKAVGHIESSQEAERDECAFC